MSSRRLLVLLTGLPETSRFRTVAERDGDWTENQYVAAETHNEVARLRASFHAAHGGEAAAYEPIPWRSPAQRRARRDADKEEAESQQQAEQQFHKDLGWT